MTVASLYPVSTEDDDGEVRHINTTRRGYTAFVVVVRRLCILREEDSLLTLSGKTLSHSLSSEGRPSFSALPRLIGGWEVAHFRRLRHFQDEGGSLLLDAVGRLLPTEGCRRYPAEHIVSLLLVVIFGEVIHFSGPMWRSH